MLNLRTNSMKEFDQPTISIPAFEYIHIDLIFMIYIHSQNAIYFSKNTTTRPWRKTTNTDKGDTAITQPIKNYSFLQGKYNKPNIDLFNIDTANPNKYLDQFLSN